MTNEELKSLGEKVANGQATTEDRLAFLRELNFNISEMRKDILILKNNQKLEVARKEILNS
ncbi:MAG: hypothetical protein ACOYMB_00705 [Patescibacteria group bacterium]